MMTEGAMFLLAGITLVTGVIIVWSEVASRRRK
jgi:hypothetical protein